MNYVLDRIQASQTITRLKFTLPADNYMFKVNNRNTKTRFEICSKLTIRTSERRQLRCSGVF